MYLPTDLRLLRLQSWTRRILGQFRPLSEFVSDKGHAEADSCELFRQCVWASEALHQRDDKLFAMLVTAVTSNTEEVSGTALDALECELDELVETLALNWVRLINGECFCGGSCPEKLEQPDSDVVVMADYARERLFGPLATMLEPGSSCGSRSVGHAAAGATAP